MMLLVVLQSDGRYSHLGASCLGICNRIARYINRIHEMFICMRHTER